MLRTLSISTRFALLAWAATTIQAAAAPANADPNDPAVSQQVSTAGLDLTRPDDQSILRHRIILAAHKVCQDVMGSDDFGSPGFAGCFKQAAREGVAQFDVKVAQAHARALVASVAAK
jgi:UrcA family protein